MTQPATEKDPKRRANVVRLLLVASGLLLLAFVVYRTGPRQIARHIALLGSSFPWIVAISSTWFLLNTAGWMVAFEPVNGKRPIGFWRLLPVHLTCEAISNITPFFSVGGEPVKVMLLRRWTTTENLTASVLNDNVVHLVSAVLFMLMGVAYGHLYLSLDPGLLVGLWVGVGATAVVALLLVVGSRHSLLARAARMATRVRPASQRFARLVEPAERVDEQLSRFVSKRPLSFALCVAAHLAGRLMGAVEAWFILHALGVSVSLGAAVFLIAVVQAMVNLAFSFVTGQYGVQETAATLLFAAVGLDPSIAVAMVLVRRIRGFFWIGVGLLLPGRRGSRAAGAA